MTLRADLHIHTHYSLDTVSSLPSIARHCARNGIDCVAICDHGRIEGALRARDELDLKIIVGEEIWTREGEILGLFLREDVPQRRGVAETVRSIKAQGGLVAVPHPFARIVPSRLSAAGLEEVLPFADVIEVRNGRSTWSADDIKAERLADRLGLPKSAGSDAHFPWEVGYCHVQMDGFDDARSFLDSLTKGRLVVRQRSSLALAGISFFYEKWNVVRLWLGLFSRRTGYW